MRVMGIDPGSNCTGFGIVEEVNGNLQSTGAVCVVPQRMNFLNASNEFMTS